MKAAALLCLLLTTAAPGPKAKYDPAAKFDLTTTEVELRRNTAGRMLMARVYQP